MTRPATLANFDLIARPYRWMEYLTLGPALQNCRNHFLSQLATRRSALVLGDGDGRFLARLFAATPRLHADAVDTSAAMLHLLTERTQRAHPTSATRLHTHHVSALTFTPTRRYDLVVTHFFLDCLTQPELNALVTHLTPHLEPGSLWLVSDFRIPAGPLQFSARVMIRMLYLVFRVLTGLHTKRIPDHAATFAASGLALTAQYISLAGLLTTEIWEYTPSMHLPPQRPKTPLPPDPVPDPEPPSPSLPEPDPGVFHHDVAAPKPTCQAPSDE
jgi:SAM-dependent methyltransferase